MIKATKSGGTGENLYGDGAFPFTLTGCTAKMGEKFETKEAVPQCTLIYRDTDGDSFEEKFVSIPKNFGINDKAKLVERIASVLNKSAKQLADEGDDSRLEFDAGPNVDSFEDFYSELASGREIKLGISYAGESIFGKACQLQIETSEKGWAKVRGSMPAASTPAKRKNSVLPVEITTQNTAHEAAF